MSRTSKATWLFSVLGFVFSLGIVSAPSSAIAVTQQLPFGESMVSIPCEENQSSLYKLDLENEDVLAIGTVPVAADVCYGNSVLDPTSRSLIVFNVFENNWQPSQLFRMDPVTGEILGNLNLVIDESTDSPDAGIIPLSGQDGYMIDSISIDSLGNLFVFLDDHKLYFANPTQIAGTYELRFLIDTPRLTLASAADPTELGSIYALFEDNDYEIENNHFYKFSISYVGNTPQSATMGSPISSECRYSCFAMSFDESGVAWIQNALYVDNDGNTINGIYTTTFESADPVYTFQAALPWYFQSLTVLPTEVLSEYGASAAEADPNTGLASTGFDTAFPLGMGLAGLLIGIGLFVSTRSKQIES